MSTANQTKFKNRDLRPQYMRKSKPNINLEKFNQFEKQRLDKQKKRKNMFLDSDNFRRNYSLPFNMYTEYINNPNFDIEYYRNSNIQKRKDNEDKIYNRSREIYENMVSSYSNYVKNLDNNSLDFDNFWYMDNVIIVEDSSHDRMFCNETRDKLKAEFSDDYIDPFV